MNIKEIREALDLTQVEMAAILGVGIMTVSKWERGIHKPTSYSIVRAIEKLERRARKKISAKPLAEN
jgi:DNA-binding transcriptional regulator YiaG